MSTGAEVLPAVSPRVHRPRRTVLGAASIVAVALLVVGCRQPNRLDMSRASRRIASSLTTTYRLPVDRVRCPDRVTARARATFACTVRIDGLPLTVRVTQRNDNGDLRVEATAAVLVMSRVRADLRRTLVAELKGKTVVAGCGAAPLRIVAPGGSFECLVSDGKLGGRVTVRVRDASGTLTYTLH